MTTLNKKRLLNLVTGSSILFFALSGISSLLNYAVYPILSRIVLVSEYGEIQFLLSAFNQLAVGFVVLNILAVIITVTTTDKGAQRDSLRSLNIIAGVIAILLALIGIVALLFFMPSLQLTSPTAILFVGLALVLNVPYTILLGKLQGNNKFIQSGVIGLVATLGKFVFSITLVLLGFGVAGAMLGIVIGMGISLALGYLYSDRHPFPKEKQASHIKNLSNLKSTALVGLFTIAVLTLFSTIDSIASRLILNTHEAGMYAAVATLAKIILAGTAPILWLTLPPAILRKTSLVKKYMLTTAAISALFILVFSVDPSSFITVSMAIDAEALAALLPLASITMGVYAIAFIVTAILLCTGKLRALCVVYTLAILSFIASILILPQILGDMSMLVVLISQFTSGVIIVVPLIFFSIHEARAKV